MKRILIPYVNLIRQKASHLPPLTKFQSKDDNQNAGQYAEGLQKGGINPKTTFFGFAHRDETTHALDVNSMDGKNIAPIFTDTGKYYSQFIENEKPTSVTSTVMSYIPYIALKRCF